MFESVWIPYISFKTKGGEGKMTADISLFENNRNRGHIATEIDNEDITNSTFLNLQKNKQIVYSTLNEHPVKHEPPFI